MHQDTLASLLCSGSVVAASFLFLAGRLALGVR